MDHRGISSALYQLSYTPIACEHPYTTAFSTKSEILLYSTDMNEFTAKKLGEVLAFTRVGNDTIEKGRSALIQVLGEEKVSDIEDKNRIHGEECLRISTDAGMVDITITKAEKTEEKLKKMRDLYVGDEWDNPTELLEWSGFFEGAAVVHFALVKGTGEALDNSALMMLAEEGIATHYEMIELAESELQSVGQNKAGTE